MLDQLILKLFQVNLSAIEDSSEVYLGTQMTFLGIDDIWSHLGKSLMRDFKYSPTSVSPESTDKNTFCIKLCAVLSMV